MPYRTCRRLRETFRIGSHHAVHTGETEKGGRRIGHPRGVSCTPRGPLRRVGITEHGQALRQGPQTQPRVSALAYARREGIQTAIYPVAGRGQRASSPRGPRRNTLSGRDQHGRVVADSVRPRYDANTTTASAHRTRPRFDETSADPQGVTATAVAGTQVQQYGSVNCGRARADPTPTGRD